MKVPQMDLKRQYLTIKSEIDSAIQHTIDRCAFVAGEKVNQFEKNFAEYCGVKHAVGISCGTSALYVALRALGIGKGDIVITVPYTFIATVEAITLTGARPVFVDIESKSYNISTKNLREYIEKGCEWNPRENELVDKKTKLKVRVILPVHLYGQMSDMDEIMAIAGDYNLSVLEDAAQAHGAIYKNRKSGSIGHIAAFSFYPSKNLGAFGQGGAVITDNDTLAAKARMLINHGQREKYDYEFEGWNFKMDGFQAAVLDVKLKHLDDWNRARQHNAMMYGKFLKDVDTVMLPEKMLEREHVYYLYVIQVDGRASLQKYLNDENIGSSIAYSIPLHMQNAYKYLGYKMGDFPNTEKCVKGVISLPMFPELTSEEIEYVCEVIKAWCSHK